MNLIAFIIGILISITIVVYFKSSRLENSKFAYPILLATLPFYYFVFAIYGNDSAALALEIVAGLLFFIIAMSVFKTNCFYKFSFLSFGYILHAVYDVIHDLLFINAGTPIWWSVFCGVIDITIGLYLANLAFKYRVKSV